MNIEQIGGIFKLFTDCQPVRGATTSAIYDLSRHRIVLIPTPYYDALLAMDGKSECAWSSSKYPLEKLREFAQFLLSEELASFVSDVNSFPPPELAYRRPGLLRDAVVDIDRTWPNFQKIIEDLDTMGCQHLQIRVYARDWIPQTLRQVIALAEDTSLRSMEFMLAYHDNIDVPSLVKLMGDSTLVARIVVHSCSSAYSVAVDSTDAEQKGLATGRKVVFTDERMSDERGCGVIKLSTLSAPTQELFQEARLYNGCLNGKVAVDRYGHIRNCPSTCSSFGRVGIDSLQQVVGSASFQVAWKLRKDEIEVCRDCQFRYACTDCRANRQVEADAYSKPRYCGYDPYLDRWAEVPEVPTEEKPRAYLDPWHKGGNAE